MYDFVAYRFGNLGLKQYPAIGQAGAVAFLAVAITVFTVYAPLAYGNPWTRDQCNSVKLFNTWDWDCNNFLTSVSYRSKCRSNTKLMSNSTINIAAIMLLQLPRLFHLRLLL